MVALSTGLARAPVWAAYHRPAGPRWIGWGVVLVAHALLITAWLIHREPVPTPPAARVVTLHLLPPELPAPEPVAAPPAPAPAVPRPRPTPLRRMPPSPAPTPVPRVMPAPPPAEAAAPKTPQHLYTESDEWVRPDAPPDAGPVARRASPAYAEAVKAGIVSKVVYPANARYPPPRGFKGDPRELMRECTIPYEVVVDRAGQIVSFEIERCGDDLLDAAAEAAIRQAQPFAPPPADAEQQRIYGSINFIKPRLDRPRARP